MPAATLWTPRPASMMVPRGYAKPKGPSYGESPAPSAIFSRMDAAQVAEENLKLLLPKDIPHKKAFRPLCVMYIGRRGQGKSLAMTTTAHIMQQRYKEKKFRYQVFTNYKCTFAQYTSPFLVDDLIGFPDWAENSHICIDEASAFAPSRRSMARDNLNFSNFLTQLRKLHSEIGFTTQFPQVMDIQLLLQVDLFIRCKLHDGGRAIELQVFDWWGQWTGKDGKKSWPPEPDTHDWVIWYHNTHTMWDKYDTDEVQAPIWSAQREDIIARSGWQLEAPGAEQAVSDKPFTEPLSLGTLLEQSAGVFSIMSILERAKLINPSIRGRSDLADWLEANGCTVTRGGPWLVQKYNADEGA